MYANVFFMKKGEARETLMLHPRDHKGLYGRDMGKLIKKKKKMKGACHLVGGPLPERL